MSGDSTPPERFWAKVDKGGPDECWPWTATQRAGYGRFWPLSDSPIDAHRFAYELLVGPVPDGLELDHLCRNKACVNPAHLEPVTHAENMRRGEFPNAQKTHCPQGHPYSGENLYVPPNGQRQCRECKRVQRTASWRRRRAA